ncbi:MAG: LTA synthase family protein [Puia sp.]|nr:LTA synthase family protein [Puia sp.]
MKIVVLFLYFAGMSPGRRFLLQFRRLFSCIGLLLSLYTANRLFFGLYNRSLFSVITFREAGRIFLLGLQQDFVSLLLLNSPVIVLVGIAGLRKAAFSATAFGIVPGAATADAIAACLYRTGSILFCWLNIAGLAINCIDIGYFRFSKHRSNMDLWYIFRDSLGSAGSLLTGYLPVALFFLAGSVALIGIRRFFSPRTALENTVPNAIPITASNNNPTIPADAENSPPGILQVLIYQLLVLILLLLPCGMLTGRPVLPGTPLLFLSPSNLPLAQNSILTFVYSAVRKQQELQQKHYFSGPELDYLVKTAHSIGNAPPVKDTSDNITAIIHDTLSRKNVVLFILESFSRCYVIPGDPQKANTPFFDSLIRESLFFPNSFANGFSSNQGIVAILGGLPNLLDEPFYYSEYANTPLKSIGNILQSAGYETDFFMGAGKDHFGFGKFSHMAGFDHYYSRDDFNSDHPDGDRYYDGNWGVFDEPFLQYGAKVLSGRQQPFLATFFTISAHPPYTIPDTLRERFADPGKTPAERSISYTDYAFQQFFETCRKAPWFRNTLFVFCADHWLSPDDYTAYTCVNSCTIPIFIYDPSEEGSVRPTLASQVDLTPTVLDILHYKGSYTGFGRSLLDTAIVDSDRYAINRLGASYQIISNGFVLGYDPVHDSTRYLYGYKTDSLLTKNLVGDEHVRRTRERLETLVRANIQVYNDALLRRSLQ